MIEFRIVERFAKGKILGSFFKIFIDYLLTMAYCIENFDYLFGGEENFKLGNLHLILVTYLKLLTVQYPFFFKN